jgi:hypothetical protein
MRNVVLHWDWPTTRPITGAALEESELVALEFHRRIVRTDGGEPLAFTLREVVPYAADTKTFRETEVDNGKYEYRAILAVRHSNGSDLVRGDGVILAVDVTDEDAPPPPPDDSPVEIVGLRYTLE